MIKLLLRNKYALIVIFLTACAAFLRLNNLPLSWSGDSARDYLVAQAIVKYDERPSLGPNAEGLRSYYPPYYTYFIALLMLLNSDVTFITVVFTFLHVLSVPVIFILTRDLYNENAGILAAVFFTFSYSAVFYSKNLWASHVLIPLSILLFVMFIKYLISRKLKYIVVTLFLLLFLNISNYSSLPVSVTVFCILLLCDRRNFKRNLALIFGFGFLFVILHIPVISHIGMQTYISPITDFQQRYPFITTILRIPEKMLMLGKAIFVNYTYEFGYSMVLLLTLLFVVLLTIRTKVQRFSKFILALLFPLTFIIMQLFLSPAREDCCAHYYIPVYPLFYIVLSLLIAGLWDVSNGKKLFRLVLLIVFSALIFFVSKNLPYVNEYAYSYRAIEEVADVIVVQLKSIKQEYSYDDWGFFHVIVVGGGVDWDSPEIWYFLEKKLKQRLVKVVNAGSNIEQINKSDFVYVVCLTEEQKSNKCIPVAQKLYPSHKKITKIRNVNIYEIFMLQ